MPVPRRYDFSIFLRVAFGDMDALGHVNNVSYARYFETARAEYMMQLGALHGGRSRESAVLVLTRLELEYRGEVVFPATLEVTVGVADISARRLVLGCTMWNEAGRCVAEGRSQHMWIDPVERRAVRIPEDFRELLARET